jgi:hypothetical protein
MRHVVFSCVLTWHEWVRQAFIQYVVIVACLSVAE